VILDTSFAEAFQGNAMFNIRAMTGLSKTEARKLVVGQEITVRGTVKRILMGVITLKDAKILSAPSRNLSSNNSGFSPKTLEWSCNVPLITFGAKGPRINATFKFKGEDVYVEFSEPMTGKILNSGPAKPDFVGNVFKLATSGKTVYEVNRVTGSLQVRSSGRIIEASSCSKIR
jgi:hypothetical protein